MKKIYHLSTCDTCKKIIKALPIDEHVALQDIKAENIDANTLDWLKDKVGSYEALFSKRAIKYKSLGLNSRELTEKEFRTYLLDEYTFLKRPFIINGEEVFIGNSKATIEAAKQSLSK